MKKILSKKDSGMLDQMLPLIVGVVILSIVLVLMLGAMESIQLKNKVDLVARRAILLLETYGYLEDSVEQELLEQLAYENVEDANIKVRGFSKESQTWGMVDASNPAAYGQKVEVEITGMAEAVFGKLPIKAVKVSTSKN